MTVIGEKTATYATLLDDLAGALTSFDNWSDADTYVKNDATAKTEDETGDEWHNNARVLADSNTGVFVLIYPHSSQVDDHDNEYTSGLRLVISSDWDSTEHYPAGDTNVTRFDANDIEQNVGFHASDTYQDYQTRAQDHYGGSPLGLWGSENSLGLSTIRDTNVSYIISANADGFNVGVWSDSDGNNGYASYTVYDYLDSRFFDDTAVPLALLTRTSGIPQVAIYGFDSFWYHYQTDGQIGNSNAPVEDGDWGVINPSSEDDTFFFRYPAVFKNTGQTVPVAYLNEAVPNDVQEGGAHGDDFTHNGTTYKVFKQSGASQSDPVTAGLRNE